MTASIVVEQNRDGQMLSLLKLDLPITSLAETADHSPLQRSADRCADALQMSSSCRKESKATIATPPPAPAEEDKQHRPAGVDYRGAKTTLCAGCGHNAISERIINAMYEKGVQPERVMKMSGIGCSSKSPAYFMNRSHSFNSVHGRMPSVATGALLANTR